MYNIIIENLNYLCNTNIKYINNKTMCIQEFE